MNNASIIDQYTFLDYKSTFDGGYLPGLIENWVGEDNLRRLKAYQLYESYMRNSAREWLNTMDEDEKRGKREYGNPHIFVETILASLLGDSQKPSVVDQDATDAEVSEYFKVMSSWFKKERIRSKIHACERKALSLGDGVYVFSPGESAGRPKVSVWDPGFYFPVWDEENPDEEFPSTVHIAYDFEREDRLGKTERFLRRRTWELVPIVDDDENSETYGMSLEDLEGQGLTDRFWNGEGETTHTVLYSDQTWRYEDIGSEDEGQIYHLNLDRVYEVAAEQEDMEIDWIPVIHIANTETDSGNRFGVSALGPVMQILDDITGTDTDLQASSALTGSPPLVVPDPIAEEDGSIRSYGPGDVIGTTGDSGSATLIDTSKALDALIKYDDKLLTRLSVNGRIPESLLGLVKPSEVPSGITLTLSFAAHTSMIEEARLVRENKYELFMKMAGRFMMKLGTLDRVLDAGVEFGTFLPADKSETKEIIHVLYTAKAISLQTAIRMMMEAGFPIDNAIEEVKRIESRDFEAAVDLGAVTGDVNEARKFLGLGPIPAAQLPEEDEDEEESFPAE